MNTQSQKKVIDVFRTFFEKIVLPAVKNQPRIMEEWKYLISILAEEPLEHTKLDLYVAMLNHQKTPNKLPAQQAYGKRQVPDDTENPPSRPTRPQGPSHSHNHQGLQDSGDRDVKQSRQQQKRRMLGALQAFHNSLLQNQQKLQNEHRGGRTIKEPEERRYF